MRRVLEPVLAVASRASRRSRAVIMMRAVDPDSAALRRPCGRSRSAPADGAGVPGGIARWQLFIADADPAPRGAASRGHPGPEELQAALAETFDDPSLQIVYRNGGGVWTSESGRPVYPPPAGSERWLTVIRDDGRIVAGIVHDASAARRARRSSSTARAYTVMTLDNQRLGGEAAALLDEVRESRMRIQASADDERRRIERDLHDGAQQRLVALRIKLELAAERSRRARRRRKRAADLRGSAATSRARSTRSARSRAASTLPARRPRPRRGAARRRAATALPASVLAAASRRYPRAIESAAYFCCLEAMQNAAKHAEGATPS